MKITKAELKQIVVEETKKVLTNKSLLSEDWSAVLGDSAIINTAIEKLKTIQAGDMKDLLEDNEYLKKFLVLLYYVDEYKKMEGEGGFGEDLEKYLLPDTIDKLATDAKTMAQVDLGDHTIKTIQDFKAEFRKAGEETTKVAKLSEGEEK
jgi:hypothetical protein